MKETSGPKLNGGNNSQNAFVPAVAAGTRDVEHRFYLSSVTQSHDLQCFSFKNQCNIDHHRNRIFEMCMAAEKEQIH